MFKRILIANRGEIAVRIIRTAQQMGIETVAVYSDADEAALHVSMADVAVHIGASSVGESYLCAERVIQAALGSGAEAIHPGYGFLSENPEFVEAVNSAGLVFIGPSAAAIRAMGLKDAAKALMHKAGVPVVPGYHDGDQSPELLASEAEAIGYPVLIKARAGGGGKGMRLVHSPEQFSEALDSAAREAQASFGDAAVLIEKYITQPRHIEVQVFGDNHGNVVHLFERDCSLQRRHQKVIEEAPAPGMTEEVRHAMTDAAVIAAKAIGYSGAGTVEFIVDASGPLRTDGFWFMEMNTRLQVEHPVTELITGIDLVEVQLRVADNGVLPFAQKDLAINGHSMEARLYAEDVAGGFLPASGKIEQLLFDDRIRVDTGVRAGDSISPFYDPMIAKVIAWAPDRSAVLDKLQQALEKTHVAGTVTNLAFLKVLIQQQNFVSADMDTGLIERALPRLVEVKEPGVVEQLLASMVLLGIDPTQPYTGWRLFGHASHLVTMQCEQTNYQRRVVLMGKGCVQLQAEHGDDALCEIKVIDYASDRLTIVLNGQRQFFRVYRWSDDIYTRVSLLFNGCTHVFEQVNPLTVSTGDGESGDSLLAPMTGVVRLLDVSVGQSVNAGDRLLVMEAMKMETSLTAPRDVIITAVHCVPGGSVEGGSVLMSFGED